MADHLLAVVIVTFNSIDKIDACLESLYSDLGAQPAELVVVDNASTDGTSQHIASRWPKVRLLAQSENLGFAAANNLGLRATRADRILLLNPDTIIHPGSLAALAAALQAHPEAGLAGPKLVNFDGSLQPSCREFPSLPADVIGMAELYRSKMIRRLFGQRFVSLSDHCCPRQVDWLSGACLLVRSAAVDSTGLMDEGFFMYSEELEWQYRMYQHGWISWFEPSARVTHDGGASTASLPGDRIIWQYESLLRFYRLHRTTAQRWGLRLLIWTITWPKILFLAVSWQGNLRRQALLHAFWKVLWLD